MRQEIGCDTQDSELSLLAPHCSLGEDVFVVIVQLILFAFLEKGDAGVFLDFEFPEFRLSGAWRLHFSPTLT